MEFGGMSLRNVWHWCSTRLNMAKRAGIPSLWTVLLVVSCLWLVLTSLPYLMHWMNWAGDPKDTGSAAGFPASLFSGLAFAGVIYATYLQRKELQLQRKELRMSRDQMKRSADAQQKAEQALHQQVDVGRKAALLQALTSLADFQVRQGQLSNDPIIVESNRRIAAACLAQARTVTQELGVTIEATDISSHQREAADDLERILEILTTQNASLTTFDNTKVPHAVLNAILTELRKWNDAWKPLTKQDEIRQAIQCLEANSISGTKSQTGADTWAQFVKDISHRVQTVRGLLPIVIEELRGEETAK